MCLIFMKIKHLLNLLLRFTLLLCFCVRRVQRGKVCMYVSVCACVCFDPLSLFSNQAVRQLFIHSSHTLWLIFMLSSTRETNLALHPPPATVLYTSLPNKAHLFHTDALYARNCRILTNSYSERYSTNKQIFLSSFFISHTQCKVSMNRCAVCQRLLESLSLLLMQEIPVSLTAAALCVCRGDLHLLY